MRFAFIIMWDFDSEADRAEIRNGKAQIIGVPNLDKAIEIARRLYFDGIDCIELCGAFGENGAREVIRATENKIPVGYVTHLPEQNDIYNSVFSDWK